MHCSLVSQLRSLLQHISLFCQGFKIFIIPCFSPCPLNVSKQYYPHLITPVTQGIAWIRGYDALSSGMSAESPVQMWGISWRCIWWESSEESCGCDRFRTLPSRYHPCLSFPLSLQWLLFRETPLSLLFFKSWHNTRVSCQPSPWLSSFIQPKIIWALITCACQLLVGFQVYFWPIPCSALW